MNRQPFQHSYCLHLTLASFLLILAGCNGKEKQAVTTRLANSNSMATAIEKGVNYLLGQQSPDDDLWHSPNYGNLKDGAAITAFVLSSLPKSASDNVATKKKMQAAVDALLPQIREHGYVTNKDGPDYTNYGSSMLLLACKKHELEIPDEVVAKLVQYLVRAQLDEPEGFAPDNVDYGGWDLSGWMTGKRPSTGTNTSVSTSVLQALFAFRKHSSLDESIKDAVVLAIEKSNTWTKRVLNNSDGGFFFHPKPDHDGNKAGWADGNDRKVTRSYGTATADGLQLLVLHEAEEATVKKTAQWLMDVDDISKVPGFEHESGEGSWAVGLRYYFYQSLGRSLPTIAQHDKGAAQKTAQSIVDKLRSEQQADGSWSNGNARMREDDPVIATGFALSALHDCLNFLEDD